MINRKIAIIGTGNLGGSLARGLVKKEVVAAKNITVTNLSLDLVQEFKDELDVNITTDNIEAVKNSDMVFVAVKPHAAPKVFSSIKSALDADKHILVSVVSGVKMDEIKDIVGDIPLSRAMPNTAMSVMESMTAICFDEEQGEMQKDVVNLFEQLGGVFTIPENQMAASTVLASCGIAFALRFMRAASMGGVEIGFKSDLSHQIAAQIMHGAAALIKDSGHHPEREIDKVTTPMGVTISGLNEMELQGFSASVVQGIRKAFNKIQTIEDK